MENIVVETGSMHGSHGITDHYRKRRDQLWAKLVRRLDGANPDFPDALKDVCRGFSFSSEHRVIAAQEFIDSCTQADNSFDAIKFLRQFCAEHPSRDGPLIVLAQKLAHAGEFGEAIRVIDDAMSLNQVDLYAQKVAHFIYEMADAGSRDRGVEEYLASHFCDEPFKHLETTTDGSVYLCCPGWLPVPVGNLHKADADGIWHGPAAQELRNSVIDGSYRYCSRMHCARITDRRLISRGDAAVEELIEQHQADGTSTGLCFSSTARNFARRFRETPRTSSGPKTAYQGATKPPTQIILSHDRSCNLSCPSCRTRLIVANKQEQRKLDSLLDTKLLPLLKGAETVKVTGSGDPFGSNHFRRLLKKINRTEFPTLNLYLHTNGQLFDEHAWNDLELSGLVNIVQISIDSTTEETYRILRRGGTFSRLLKNLEFIKKLREIGEIKYLDFLMVVQNLNFKEMPEFVRLGLRYGADTITFQLIRNWGTYTQSEFREHNIAGHVHPRHNEFLAILRDPLLSHPAVLLNDVAPYRERE
jgi:pyruvate-formate lyase-activating enzyme